MVQTTLEQDLLPCVASSTGHCEPCLDAPACALAGAFCTNIADGAFCLNPCDSAGGCPTGSSCNGTTCGEDGRCVDAANQGNDLALWPVIGMPQASGAATT